MRVKEINDAALQIPSRAVVAPDRDLDTRNVQALSTPLRMRPMVGAPEEEKPIQSNYSY